jgi:hypothetical protein
MIILAIDPGCIESAYVLMDSKDLKPIEIGKIANELLIGKIIYELKFDELAIEMVASYGMPVGKEVFETVFWIGRFWESACSRKKTKIYRTDEKMNLCGVVRARDSNITQALIDRFAYAVPNKGKGIKKAPGWFYGFKADIWAAYAVGVTYCDMYMAKEAKP